MENEDSRLLIVVNNDEQREFLDSDDALFHYTKSSTALEHILKEMKLRLSPLKSFIGTKEYFFHQPSGFGFRDRINDSSIEEKRARINWEVDKLKKKVNIGCFCSNKQRVGKINVKDIVEILKNQKIWIARYYDIFMPNKGYDKDRMWETYAENMKGVCLVFSKEDINKEIKNKGFKYLSYSVKYCKDYFNEIESYDFNNPPDREAKKFLESKLFIKPFDYRDENEYRILIYSEGDEEIFIDIKDSLKGIIFGMNLNEIYFNLYFDLIDKVYGLGNDIIILKAEMSRGLPYYYYLDARKR